MNTQLSESRPNGLPASSWWVAVTAQSFTQKCHEELARMRWSKEHQRIGVPMVVGQIDGKQARTS